MNKLWFVALGALLVIPFAVADDHEEEERERRRRGSEGERLERILEGLEHGMHALEQLGRERELRMLAEVAEDVRRRIRGSGDQRKREREFVHHQIRALRIAFELYVDSDEKKMRRLAEMVEHAIHARELRMEGRRDREAMEVYESAPNEGNTIELLLYAERLLKEKKKGERAEYVGEIARKMQAHWKERREHEREREHAERDRARHRERAEHEGDLERRVIRLEKSVAQLARIIEKLVDEFEELEEEVDELEDEIEEDDDDEDEDDDEIERR